MFYLLKVRFLYVKNKKGSHGNAHSAILIRCVASPKKVTPPANAAMELQLWLRLLVVGSLAAATNSAAGLTNTSSNTCPYDPTLAARWLRSHNYSWGRLTQCPQASWVER